ncbi:unnamed protein product [Sphagnum jensenii]
MTDKFLVTEGPDSLGHASETHPSYGVIGVSRISGQQPLFDSDVVHGHFIEITIQEATKHRTGFTHEHVHGNKQLIKVRMSFAQYAQMITTQNLGDGTPCTIHYVKGDEKEPYVTHWGGRPDPPNPKPFIDKFKAVGKERAQAILNNIETASAMMKNIFEGDVNPTKKNLEVAVKAMASAKQDVKANLPYLMECLEEEMEVKLSNAVTEFESYVAASLQEKGIEVMRDNTMRLNVGKQKAIGSEEAPIGSDVPESISKDIV